MGKPLILTGVGLNVYAYAGAIALRHYGWETDLYGVSKERLAGKVEEVAKNGEYGEVAILGIGLQEDTARLGKALAKCREKGIRVLWISAMDFHGAVGEDVRGNLEAHVEDGGVLPEVTARFFGEAYDAKEKVWDMSEPLGRSYADFIQAANHFQSNYDNEQIYRQVITHLAKNALESEWTSEEKWMVNYYRRYGHRELTGKSPCIEELRKKVKKVAGHPDTRVLILGESGTGKETVAVQLHYMSSRRKKPFISFNCATVNPGLLESRFLGAKKGAFTGAYEDQDGLFMAADKGTLFLDEIGELPLEAQGVLLRVLQEGVVQKLGENKEGAKVDVRVIAATNRDLPALVREGKFREDLYQRLSVVMLRMPALRERKEDIPRLAKSYRARKKVAGKLTPEQIAALQEYDFPGNVRELENLLERAYVLEENDFRKLIQEQRELNAGMGRPQTAPENPVPSAEEVLPDNLDEAMRVHVRRVFKRCGSNVTEAARRLGITRNTARKYLDGCAKEKEGAG